MIYKNPIEGRDCICDQCLVGNPIEWCMKEKKKKNIETLKQVYLDIMSSTQSKGEWEWALAELLKLKEEEE